MMALWRKGTRCRRAAALIGGRGVCGLSERMGRLHEPALVAAPAAQFHRSSPRWTTLLDEGIVAGSTVLENEPDARRTVPGDVADASVHLQLQRPCRTCVNTDDHERCTRTTPVVRRKVIQALASTSDPLLARALPAPRQARASRHRAREP